MQRQKNENIQKRVKFAKKLKAKPMQKNKYVKNKHIFNFLRAILGLFEFAI